MSPTIALFLCLIFIGWLFFIDRRQQSKVSPALWIPLLWLFILASRPISLWFGFSAESNPVDAALEGSPLDRMFFLVLILAGLWVLAARRANWSMIVRENRWLFIFFFYLLISVLWSDYPYVSFKRWFKDFGNVIMVLVVLTEPDPVRAVRTLLTRCCYLLLPLSVLVIKYFPESGRSYDRWTGVAYYCGVATDKNMLGMTLLSCGLALIWIFLDLRRQPRGPQTRKQYFIVLVMGAMMIWLLNKAHSSTGLVCILVGGCILVALTFPAIRARIRSLWIWSASILFLILFLHFTFHLDDVILRLLGRDVTLTGRTQIWSTVLGEKTNFLFGEGFYSFWLGDRAERLSAAYHYELGTAHNGYLETYLNSGWVGLLLLGAVFVATGKRIKWDVIKGESFAAFRLACFVAVILYAMTEAVFNRLGPVWFLFLLIAMEYPVKRVTAPEPVRAQTDPTDNVLLNTRRAAALWGG